MLISRYDSHHLHDAQEWVKLASYAVMMANVARELSDLIPVPTDGSFDVVIR